MPLKRVMVKELLDVSRCFFNILKSTGVAAQSIL